MAPPPEYMPMPPGEPLRGIAQGRLRHQAARVDRLERHVGADRGVDGGVQLRLVVDAVQPQAAGEVDQRLSSRSACPAS